MTIDRRMFIKAGLASLTGSLLAAEEKPVSPRQVGCLVDTTLCIGCRKCEEACNRRNKLPRPDTPFTDRTVLRNKRHPSTTALTVVNKYNGQPSPDQPHVKETFCKIQCMHCLNPSCVSACIVGALLKAADGSVVYKPDICLGCRYCMVACPFDVPAYQYDEVLAPKVVKCQFCAELSKKTGADPACAAACPTEALVFGERKRLLELARHRIKKRPDRYINHIYGEHEVGGTAWIYLTGRPHTEVGLQDLPGAAPPVLTESIQHGVYKYGAIPLALYGVLSASMWLIHRNQKKQETKETQETQDQQEEQNESKTDS